MRENIKNFIFKHPKLIGGITKIYDILNLTNSIKGLRGNSFSMGAVLLQKCRINIVGRNNTIVIRDFSRLIDTKIYIYGNNNRILIDKRCYVNRGDFYIEDDNNEIRINQHTSIDGNTHFAAIEGTRIDIGKDCMFSGNINVRTGDSHSLYNNLGNRINHSKNVSIGKHCWIGMNSTIMKGVHISDNSIVGAGAIVTKQFKERNCIIAGNPGKVVKRDVDWGRVRT